ncbi:hypothetical protein [Streptomyces sp. NPDC101178]|uniref:hypothetical protein n=1 Tax=Streptomyces sp. NPDC101178 TaxID=3366124 RepID=UPI00380EB526
MDSTIILVVLAVFGVLAIFVWSLQSFVKQLQSFFDDLPAFFASFHRAKNAMRDQSRRKSEQPTEAEPSAVDELPELPSQATEPLDSEAGEVDSSDSPRRDTPA